MICIVYDVTKPDALDRVSHMMGHMMQCESHDTV